MKAGITSILVVACLCLGIAPASAADNLIRNGSFEQARGERPVGWRPQTYSGTGSFGYEASGRTGERCVRISSTAGADIGWLTSVPVKTRTDYVLSGWVKTEEVKGAQGALLNVHNIQSARTNAVSGTQDWTKVECRFNTGASDRVEINCLFGGWGQSTGTAWYDDISLVEVPTLPWRQTHPGQKRQGHVRIDAGKTAHPVSEYIYGQFIEHLGRCIYGGIWAEMLEDRKFFYAVPARREAWQRTGAGAWVLRDSPWKVVGPEDAVRMAKDDPWVGEHTPEITVGGEPAGIAQGDLGVVAGKGYVGRVILAGEAKAAPIEVRLVWGDGAQDCDVVHIERISKDYVKYPLSFRAGAATETARLEIVGQGQGTFRVGAVSLMPADNVQGFRADTLGLLRQLDSPVYRWPGGNFVSGYDWRDGLGDPDKRPTRTNPAWTGIETNDVGLHEFMALCRLLDAEPYIAVNTGLGKVEDAGLEVQYCNGSVDTPMGKRRAENGHPEPFGVKFWAVGNEMYGGWQLGHMPLEEYVKKHNAVAEAMWKADRDIVLVAVGAVGRWSEETLKNCADHMTHISEHFYCQERPDVAAHVAQIPDNVRRIAEAHRRYRKEISGLEHRDIRIALDEWNYWYGPHVFGELGTRYFLKDALGIAAGLHEYIRHSDLYWMANYAQTVNVIGCIKTTKTSAAFETTALPLMLYRKEFGVAPVAVTHELAPLDVVAAWTADQSALTVAVVNPTPDTVDLTLDVEGAVLAGPGTAWTIAGDDPMLFNDPGQAPVVKIRTQGLDAARTLTSEPLSISLYRLTVR